MAQESNEKIIAVSKEMRGDGQFNWLGYDPTDNNLFVNTYRTMFKAIDNLDLWDFIVLGPPNNGISWCESDDIRVYNIMDEMSRIGYEIDKDNVSFAISAIRLMEYLAKFGEDKFKKKLQL
jgi:hypothetical protein